jgi:hypothetical protein
MFNHPDLMLLMAREHNKELIEHASRHRLASALRRGARQLWPDSQPKVRDDKTVAKVSKLGGCDGLPQVVGQAQ